MKHSRIYSCPFFLVSLLLVAQFWLCLAPAAYATDMLTTGSGSYDISKATISPIPDCDFNGNAQEPSFTVTLNGVTLQPESEYNYETGEYIEGDYYAYYENNVRPGKASITITGTNEYSGSKTVYFNIIGEFKDSSIVWVQPR